MKGTIAELRHKLALIAMLLSIPGEQLTDGARIGGIIVLDEIDRALREGERLGIQ